MKTEDRDLLRRTLYPNLGQNDFDLFVATCDRTALDPFARQIYAITRNQKRGDGWVAVMSIQVSIDGLRLQAERSGKYLGQEGPYWCADDGQWRDVWLDVKPPAAARVGVIKAGNNHPTYAVATFRSYCQSTKEGKPLGMWATMADNQLAKCAESLALRKCFPAELSGLYTHEEMAQASDEAEPRVIVAPEITVESPEPPQETAEVSAAPHPLAQWILHYSKLWHATAAGTPYATDEARHEFIANYTAQRTESLTAFLRGGTTQDAIALIGALKNAIAASRINMETGEIRPEVVTDPTSEPWQAWLKLNMEAMQEGIEDREDIHRPSVEQPVSLAALRVAYGKLRDVLAEKRAVKA